MMDRITFLRRIARQTVVLAGLTALMVAAGMDWAHAATGEVGSTMPSALHVIVLFLATIAFVVRTIARPPKPARAKARRPGLR